MTSPQSTGLDTLTLTPFTLRYSTLRNISSPTDTAINRRVYSGHAPIDAVLDLKTDQNVREFLVDLEAKQRKAMTQVHRAILETLRNSPENFSILNGGMVIVASTCEVDDNRKTAILTNPSIINGAQTQGIIRKYLDECKKKDVAPYEAYITFELIVTDDQALIGEISVARNYQNDVALLSIAGRRGQLDELEEALQKQIPEQKIRKSESDLGEDFVNTERLLQIITALIPQELWLRPLESGAPNKTFTYSQKASCLKDFQTLYSKVREQPNASKKEQMLYQFFLDVAADALNLFYKWKSHQGFYGTRLRAISRDESGVVLDVPDGIVFPIIASLSVFAEQTSDGWRINIPPHLNESRLIDQASSAYKDIADSNPNVMGKNRGCYSSLLNITQVYKDMETTLESTPKPPISMQPRLGYGE